MANKKITDLSAKTTATNVDIVPIVDPSDNTTKRTTVGGFLSALLSLISSGSLLTTDMLEAGAVTAGKTAFGGNYSTSEVDTGFTWIDGKTIYKKAIDMGSGPNNTVKDVAHGITGLETVVDMYGFSRATTLRARSIVAGSSTTSTTLLSTTTVDTTNVSWRSSANLSGETAYIVLYYTKT